MFSFFQMVTENLKPQAMLFVLDRPLLELIELSFGITESEDFELIHKELCDFHTLNIEAFKHLRLLYHKHFGDEKHFRVNLSINLFIAIWIKAPKSDVKYQNSLDCLFQNNSEKYNPEHNFLSAVAFMNFENSFTKRKEAEGWTPRRIDDFVQMEKEKRHHLLIEFTDIKKELDVAQYYLLNKFQLLIKEGRESNEGDEKCLESYLKLKKIYSTVKKNVYYSSLYKED